MISRARSLVITLAVLSASACAETAATGGASTASGQRQPIEQVWRARCGACHRRVEPGTRTQAHLEQALSRHRKRVRLTEDEWSALIGFLASTAPAPAGSTPNAASKDAAQHD